MRKIILYCLLLGAAILLPVQGTDVGKLLPVELIGVYREGEMVVISTDVGLEGTGKTIREAIADMKETAAGIVFLDTADFLLLKNVADEEVETVKEHVKGSIRICNGTGDIELKEACAFLRIHKPKLRLRDWNPGKERETLTEMNGKLVLK